MDANDSSRDRPRAVQSALDLAPGPGTQPAPIGQRAGVALCLSGGGYRAALFHLGATRRLNETGILSRVTTVTSVSGGSILAAHLARLIGENWPAEGLAYPDWQVLEDQFRAFCTKNIRTGPLLQALLPWNWARSDAAVRALIGEYRSGLSQQTLAGLPERPRYVFCATDLTHGVNWIFSRERVGSYAAGYVVPTADSFDVATAVGASSCFPPVFNPLPIDLGPDVLHGEADANRGGAKRIPSVRLSDGGLYDNMGLEPVWKRHAYVLVSEGGSTFEAQADQGLFWRLNRYVEVMGSQVGAVRKRWLIASFRNTEQDQALRGTYWGIGSHTRNYADDGSQPVPGYPDDLVDDVISEVRTDLDRFTDAEQKVLINQGYIVAEAATRRWTPTLRSPTATAFDPPFPDFLDAQLVRTAMAESHRRRFPFGRR
jgi:NTE family protein